MKHLKEFNQWFTSSSTGADVNLEYTSKDKIYYNSHKVLLSHNGKTVEVTAKFDTGAKSSSIDFKVAEKLGISKDLLEKCKELETINDIPLTISKLEKSKMENEWTKKLKEEFPGDVSYAKIVKSSSGVSVRAYVPVQLSYNGRVINTNVNLRNRQGLTCEMLVGLDDML